MNDDPIRIFAGCDPNDCDLEQMMVLEYSLRKHASQPIELHWMQLSPQPSSFWYSDPATAAGWRTGQWATPFSGFRWAVPARCDYQGRAIYMDTDTIVLTDIAALWNAPIEGAAVVVARPQSVQSKFPRFCVSLWDCAKARDQLPALDELRSRDDAHARCLRHFREHPELIQPIDPAFNNIDGENRPVADIAILHYSDMGTQFSHRLALPRVAAEGRTHWFDGKVLPHPRRDLVELFDRTYAEALASGRRLDDYRSPAPFGAFPKKSERRYAGNRVTRRGFGAWTRRLFGR